MKNKIIRIAGIVYGIIPKIFINFCMERLKYIRGSLFSQTITGEKIINISQKDKHVFFGYYDITPFSEDDSILLAMQTPFIKRSPGIRDEAEIGFYQVNYPERGFTFLGRTSTWCWQQGCRLQWYGKDKNQIIYNCIVNGEYGFIIAEVPSGRIIKKIKKPLYSISEDGDWGLSLNFSRLQRLRPGYGYGILPDNSANNPRPDDDGVELINLKTGESKLLFSVKDIAEIKPHNSMDGANHYFNHLMINPSGSKFLFFHLWMKDEKRHSRMFVMDKNGENIKLLNNSGSVSHYNWVSDDEIILYSLVGDKNKYTYAIFNSLSGKISYFGKNVPKKDGHPTLLKNGKIFITDTYPDLLSQRSLLSYDIERDEAKVLARFDDPRNFTGEFRCDLHPRISNNEKMICVDRIINGKRNISIIPVDTGKL